MKLSAVCDLTLVLIMWTFRGDVVVDSPEPAVATKLEQNIISHILAPP